MSKGETTFVKEKEKDVKKKKKKKEVMAVLLRTKGNKGHT